MVGYFETFIYVFQVGIPDTIYWCAGEYLLNRSILDRISQDWKLTFISKTLVFLAPSCCHNAAPAIESRSMHHCKPLHASLQAAPCFIASRSMLHCKPLHASLQAAACFIASRSLHHCEPLHASLQAAPCFIEPLHDPSRERASFSPTSLPVIKLLFYFALQFFLCRSF